MNRNIKSELGSERTQHLFKWDKHWPHLKESKHNITSYNPTKDVGQQDIGQGGKFGMDRRWQIIVDEWKLVKMLQSRQYELDKWSSYTNVRLSLIKIQYCEKNRCQRQYHRCCKNYFLLLVHQYLASNMLWQFITKLLCFIPNNQNAWSLLLDNLAWF